MLAAKISFTMICSKQPTLSLGYDLDAWENFREKSSIQIDTSPSANSHILLCGMSGSGKSYLEHQLLYRLILAEQDRGGEYFFADYKGDDSFTYLQDCPRYFTYKNTLKALDMVHARMIARQSGEDPTQPGNFGVGRVHGPGPEPDQ